MEDLVSLLPIVSIGALPLADITQVVEVGRLSL